MPTLAGIEEAGRGPVIGPMVMAIAVIDSAKEPRLREIGVKDSKQLSPNRRTIIFEKLKEILDAYYRDRTLANIDLIRGEDIPDDLKKWQPELEKEFKTTDKEFKNYQNNYWN